MCNLKWAVESIIPWVTLYSSATFNYKRILLHTRVGKKCSMQHQINSRHKSSGYFLPLTLFSHLGSRIVIGGQTDGQTLEKIAERDYSSLTMDLFSLGLRMRTLTLAALSIVGAPGGVEPGAGGPPVQPLRLPVRGQRERGPHHGGELQHTEVCLSVPLK